MPCYSPIRAYRSRDGINPDTGKWPIVFNIYDGYGDLPIDVPCGQCIGCRLERSRQWAIRCVHEASLYDNNCFVTLTFDDDHLDKNLSLNKRDFVLFMKKLRFKFGQGIRFFHCGEYGFLLQRPHHHVILFNFDFPDKYLWDIRNGNRLYRSPELEALWPYGFSSIGDVTFESCAYVARYIMKKVTGKNAGSHYNGREPEYITMSRRPGIAREWFDKYQTDVFPNDYVVIRNGLKCKPPKYYDNIYDKIDPKSMKHVKFNRKLDALKRKDDNFPRRLNVRERIQELRAEKLVRVLE
jgi:hypothetical protein